MKLSKIALAAAAVCGAGLASATTVDIYVSGSTATDPGVEAATKAVCVSNVLRKYTASNQYIYECAPNLGSGAGKINLPAGTTQLVVHKFSQGGSGNGVTPVNNGSALAFLDLAKVNAACGTASTGTFGSQVDCSGSYAFNSTVITSNAVSQIGISDVEPSFFGAAAGNYNNLTSEALATVIFAVPVSKVAYNALQTAQGITNVGSTAEADMPSLTQPQVTTILTQPTQFWSAVTGAVIPGTTAGATDFIFVARRPDSSGTQKTFEGVIARTPNGISAGKSCNLGVDGFLQPDNSVASANNTVVATDCNGSTYLTTAGSGSGQVAECLRVHNAGGRGAVGVLTTEALPSDSANGYAFVKINGWAPTAANVIAGHYTYYADVSLNTKPSTIDSNHAAYKSALKANFTVNPVVQTFGAAGLMALNVVTGLTTGNPWSRLNATGVLNNCQTARKPL